MSAPSAAFLQRSGIFLAGCVWSGRASTQRLRQVTHDFARDIEKKTAPQVESDESNIPKNVGEIPRLTSLRSGKLARYSPVAVTLQVSVKVMRPPALSCGMSTPPAS